MPALKSFDEVKATFEDRGYVLLETEYTGQMQKMKFICPHHQDRETMITYKQLRRGEGCKYCGIQKVAKVVSKLKRKWTMDDVKKTLQSNGCELLEEEYNTSNDKIKYKCKCGRISQTTFKNYVKGNGICKSCSMKENIEKKWTNENVKVYFQEQGCELLSEYKDIQQRLKYKCSCGNISYVKLSNFQRGNRCKECANNRIRHDYDFVRTFFQENGCTLISEKYTSSTFQKLDYICSCGNPHSIRFLSFQRGERCPNCKSISKGEKAIKSYLDKRNIEYQYQYKIDQCKNINPLPFDFALFENNKLKCLIEFDGKQHFKPIEMFGGQKYLGTVQKHDKIKNDFCRANNIALYRISYKEIKKIKSILDGILSIELKAN